MPALTKPILRKLIDRLCTPPSADPTLFGEGVGQAVREEFARALQRCASEDHATRTVDRIIECARWRPSAAELLDAITQTPVNREPTRAKGGCSQCAGSGFSFGYWAISELVRSRRRLTPSEVDAYTGKLGLETRQQYILSLDQDVEIREGAERCACLR